ncbi:hypothetical protein [Streptococcus sp. Marseille-Q7156]
MRTKCIGSQLDIIPGADLTRQTKMFANKCIMQAKAVIVVVTPADKTVVSDPNALTPEEKKVIEDKVKAVNPGSTVVVDDAKGKNALMIKVTLQSQPQVTLQSQPQQVRQQLSQVQT